MSAENSKNLKFWGELISKCQAEGQSCLPEDVLEIWFKGLGGESFKHLLKTALDTYCDPTQSQGDKATSIRNFRYQVLKQIQKLEEKGMSSIIQKSPSTIRIKPSSSAPVPDLKLVEDKSSPQPKPPRVVDTDPWGEDPI